MLVLTWIVATPGPLGDAVTLSSSGLLTVEVLFVGVGLGFAGTGFEPVVTVTSEAELSAWLFLNFTL